MYVRYDFKTQFYDSIIKLFVFRIIILKFLYEYNILKLFDVAELKSDHVVYRLTCNLLINRLIVRVQVQY